MLCRIAPITEFKQYEDQIGFHLGSNQSYPFYNLTESFRWVRFSDNSTLPGWSFASRSRQPRASAPPARPAAADTRHPEARDIRAKRTTTWLRGTATRRQGLRRPRPRRRRRGRPLTSGRRSRRSGFRITLLLNAWCKFLTQDCSATVDS